ncbi:hypothetical protein EJ08DRAFT_615264 [Tothia fuscella]|uniref:Uncharacterized protein n=1 Tax=Tothia fuscella TaxID=1048955 RepID=A0A9P4TX45_9PEZI|nr:hypothetical protein EJ08DRAFT_615264 [Tothia fuscella]
MSPGVIYDDNDEADPVLAEYDVFISPELSEQIYLVQYPNRSRDQPYNDRTNSKPLEVRIKPQTGFMEVDISTTVYVNFDKTKGVMWGEALKTAKDSNIHAFGMAAGFGKGSRPTDIHIERAGRRGGRGVQTEIANFETANQNGNVLNKQTLGGQIIQPEPGMPLYMLGAFRGNELHLTQVAGIAQMRPQFHHIDAQSQIVKSRLAQHRASKEAPRTGEPRVVQQIVKTTGANGEEFQFTATSEFMTKASEEKWTKLRYHDEDTDEAYQVYREKLFVKDTAGAPHLSSTMNNEQFLDAISAPKFDPSTRTKRKPLTKKDRVEQANEEAISAAQAAPTVARDDQSR